MHVVATAGHVDHGKSTLVTALTGTDPDRYAEEKRRGLTIDLGFAWTELDGEQVSFVDVPGHERFVTTMLAGVGPVPAAALVVAADGGWMPQSQEHLDALDALGVRHGLLVLTRCDLAAPDPAQAEARRRLAGTGLADVEAVRVSAVTGEGMDSLRTALVRLVRSLPAPPATAPVRLWVDRVFTVRGAGTVVTGTLPAGTLRTGDRLELPGGREVAVRGLESLGRPATEVPAVARVAVNLRGVPTHEVTRGDALTTPGTHLATTEVDVRLPRTGAPMPRQAALHIGSAHVTTQVRALGAGAARLRLRSPLPLRIGDVGLLRDPGRHQVLTGLVVLDVDPPPLQRRGAAAARAVELDAVAGHPAAADEVRRRRVVRRAHLVAMGVPARDASAVTDGAGGADPEWVVDPDHADALFRRLLAAVRDHLGNHPLDVGLPVEAARQQLGLPTAALVAGLVRPPLRVVEGRVVDGRREPAEQLPPNVGRAVAAVRAELSAAPYAAPTVQRLFDLGLGRAELAAAVRVAALAKVADGVYLTPEALAAAVVPLRRLREPFTLSQAREVWGTSRRVAVPLLEHLDRQGLTERLPDDRRRLAVTASRH